MRALKTFPPLIPRLCSNFLPFFAALALLLTASGLNVTVGTHILVKNWQQRLAHRVLITLPQASPPEQADALPPKEILLQLLRNDAKIRDVKIMTEAEMKHLMSQWGSSWTAPFPLIVSFPYEGKQQDLEELVRRKLPDAMVVFPPDVTQGLSSILRPLQLAGNFVSLFLILTGEAVFILSFILSLSHGWQKHLTSLKILFHSGCSEQIFFRSLQRQIGWRCLAGGYAGLMIMVPFLNIMTSILRPLMHLPTQPDRLDNIFFHNPFGPFLTFSLLLWPVLNCLVGWGLAACFLRHPSRRFYE